MSNKSSVLFCSVLCDKYPFLVGLPIYSFTIASIGANPALISKHIIRNNQGNLKAHAPVTRRYCLEEVEHEGRVCRPVISESPIDCPSVDSQ